MPPSRGGTIDHIGFSVDDVAGKLAQAVAAGAKVLEQPAARDGRAAAMIEDPWGTSIELLEDPDFPGYHHVHVMNDSPETLRDWYVQTFGGVPDAERSSAEVQAIRYGNFFVYISPPRDGGVVPARGRAIDHMGWRIPNVHAFARKIEAAGYPPELIRPNEDGSTLLFFTGAGEVYFEMAQPPR
jgi:4-hydroxyphenylpyruvate dioxygenase-like putative hemolysin